MNRFEIPFSRSAGQTDGHKDLMTSRRTFLLYMDGLWAIQFKKLCTLFTKKLAKLKNIFHLLSNLIRIISKLIRREETTIL